MPYALSNAFGGQDPVAGRRGLDARRPDGHDLVCARTHAGRPPARGTGLRRARPRRPGSSSPGTAARSHDELHGPTRAAGCVTKPQNALNAASLNLFVKYHDALLIRFGNRPNCSARPPVTSANSRLAPYRRSWRARRPAVTGRQCRCSAASAPAAGPAGVWSRALGSSAVMVTRAFGGGSSAGQSSGLIIRRSWVRAPPAPPGSSVLPQVGGVAVASGRHADMPITQRIRGRQ